MQSLDLTIRQRPEEQGRQAARLLLSLLNAEDSTDRHVTLPAELVVRGSTQPPLDRASRSTRR